MNNTSRAVFAILLILISAMSLNFIVWKLTAGTGVIDLTANKRYTLTDGTKKVMGKIQRPVTIKLYYAKEAVTRTGHEFLARFNNHYFFMRDLLRTFERESGGRVRFEEHDPRPWSDAAQEAETYGIKGFPLSRQTDEVFYFGLVLTTDTGSREVIELLDPQKRGLAEYEIAKMIDRVSTKRKFKLGVISSLPIVGEDLTPQMMQMRRMMRQQVKRPWTVIQELKQSRYDVSKINTPVEEIPADIEFLLVVHPKKLSDKTLFAIDQYVMKGGKMLVFTDPYCMVDQPPPNPRNPFAGMNHPRSSDLNRLLEAWGVRTDAKKMAGDRELAQMVSAGRNGGSTSFVGMMQLDAQKGCFNDEQVPTQGLQNVSFLFPGALTRVDGRETKVSFLMRTTATGNTWTANSFEMGGPAGLNIQKLNDKFSPGAASVLIAAMLQGKFKSAFPSGLAGEDSKDKPKDGDDAEPKPTSKPAEEGKPKSLTESKDGARVIVVADVDMLSDSVAYQQSLFGMAPRDDNSTFLLNALEFLSGSDALIELRSRGDFKRDLKVLTEIRRKSEEKTDAERRRIEEQIEKFQTDLRQLQSKATEKNVGKLQSEALKKRRETRVALAKLKQDLRELKRDARESMEGVKGGVTLVTMVAVPLCVLLLGVLVWVFRASRRQTHVRGGVS